MDGLIKGAISHSRMVLTILVVALIAGASTYVNLPKEADPDVPIPVIGISVPLEGASPEDVERLIVRPLEKEIRSVEGLIEYDGIASEGYGVVIVEFEASFDDDQALIDVREKVDLAKREFPEEAREPVISEINASLAPILVVNMYGSAPDRGLNRMALDLQDKLEGLEGVLEANISGNREEVLEIVVDPVKLESYNLSYQQLIAAVTGNNKLIPTGQIDTGKGRFPVKIPSLIRKAQDAFDLPILESGDAVVTLSDVADIRRTFKDRVSFARFNGEPSIQINVVKRPGANILETVKAVNELTRLEQGTWPETIRASVTRDVSKVIEDQLASLQSTVGIAVVLVMIVVIAALGLRSAGMVGIAIPGSFVIAFLILGMIGFTINSMVMFGMIIAVGILVDGAIVIVEYADRKMAEGLTRQEAYGLAANRMFWPIVASSGTTMAAFFPFLFWNSVVGTFMSYLPITLMCVLTASLIMALIFLPVIGSVIGGRIKSSGGSALAAVSGEAGDPRDAPGWIGRYARMTGFLIARPILVTVSAFSLIIAIFIWFGSTEHKSELFLDEPPEWLYVFVRAKGNLSAHEEISIVRKVEEKLLKVEGIEFVMSTAGSDNRGEISLDGVSSPPRDTIGEIFLELYTKSDGNDSRETQRKISEALEGLEGISTELRKLETGPPVGKDVEIALRSDDHESLLVAVDRVRKFLDSMDGLKDIEDSRPLPGIEYRLLVDRAQAGKFGVDVASIGSVVQFVTNGLLIGFYRPDDAPEEIDIRIRLPAKERSVEAIDRLKIATPSGQVPLSEFVTRVPSQRVSNIERRSGKRMFLVRANAEVQGEGAKKIREVREWLDEASINPSVDIDFVGSDEEAAEASEFFATAAIVALILMGVILLWEFNNFYHVLLTLSAVILSTAGVLIGIQVYLSYISILMIGIGIVALAGIVVNNNIVMIDTFQRLRRDNRTGEEAAIAAAAQRIRPILLTTLTTVCGLMPMMFKMNVDFRGGIISFGGSVTEWWIHLATAVIFGLGFSTLMALIVTPVWLAAPEKLGSWRKRMVVRGRELLQSV